MGAQKSPLTVLNRRKWLILGVLVVSVAAAVVASQLVEKVYSSSSTLLVAVQSEGQTFDSVQASQAIARSYADIIDSPNIAADVAEELGEGTTAREVKDATSFEVIPETQLLKLNAQAPTGARAKEIADAYATVFIDYAARNLGETTQASLTLADAAPVSGSPSRPKPKLYVAVAAILGLGLGLGLAFLRERLDRRLRTAEDVEANFDTPVLAQVPRRGRTERSVVAFKEAHRLLRTNLQFAGGEAPLRAIADHERARGRGQDHHRRHDGDHECRGGPYGARRGGRPAPARAADRADARRAPSRCAPGFSNYLVETATLEQAIHPTGHNRVSILPAGPIPPSPSALLEARRARTNVLTEAADLVIFDCPPLNIGADASLIADRVDGVVLVVDLFTSTTNSVRQALRQLEAVHAPLLGLVINRDRSAAPTSYDYYYQPMSAPPVSPSAENGRVRGRPRSARRSSRLLVAVVRRRGEPLAEAKRDRELQVGRVDQPLERQQHRHVHRAGGGESEQRQAHRAAGPGPPWRRRPAAPGPWSARRFLPPPPPPPAGSRPRTAPR